MPWTSSRRHVIVGLPFLLASCAALVGVGTADDKRSASIYGPISDPPFRIPPLDLRNIDPSVLRQEVAYDGVHQPGTVIVSTFERRLFLIEDGGRALRFGIGVGRTVGLNFRGSAVIGRKAKWPSWRPTPTMIARIPQYAAYADGMRGGLNNPLGARALYLYRNGEDTNFRIHGTNEPESIGKAVSSGCIRLFNHDIIYLHDRLPIGTPVFVQHARLREIS